MTQEADELVGKYFPVLDHGFVALVDYMGDDAAIVQAARTSYGAGTKTPSDDRGLLRYMMRHTHTSPFEMVELKFHVRLPIFVARQLIRHRTASVNEYSLRYSLPSMQFYMPELEHMGSQSKKNRQGRAEPIDVVVGERIRYKWKHLQEEAAALYELCVGEGIDLARELARLHLPLSLYTEWYWKIDLKNCLDFLKLRVDKHAQWEIQETARVKAGICNVVAPNAFEAFVDYKYQSKTFSRMEMQLLRHLIFDSSGALEPRATSIATKAGMLNIGMSKREVDELFQVFATSDTDPFAPEVFKLDYANAKTAEYFAAEHAKYVPKVDKK
jgi:thymidylate synthase (FAD)